MKKLGDFFDPNLDRIRRSGRICTVACHATGIR
jgi:hypothetical protein